MKSIAAIVFVLIAINVMAQTESLKLSSDIWPPFTNVEEEKAIAMDIVEEALNSININVNFEIVNFGLVMDKIESGESDGSAALWWDKSREEYLVFSDPYLQNQLVLVGRKGSDVKLSSFAELENIRIGLVENYAYGDSLLNEQRIQIIYGNSDQQNLERLLSNQIDYFLVDALIIQYLLKYQLNDVSEFLEIGASPLITKHLHLAIRKDIPDANQIITKFNEAITKMIADGSYNEILELSWIKADVDGDGMLELILAGNEAGTEAPDNSYHIFYSDQNQIIDGYYVDGKMYKSWKDLPEKYKVEIPVVEPQPDLKDSNMKIKF